MPASPHHFTHLGVCYPGDVAYMQISSPNNLQPATVHVGQSVPEPSATVMFAFGVLLLAVKRAFG